MKSDKSYIFLGLSKWNYLKFIQPQYNKFNKVIIQINSDPQRLSFNLTDKMGLRQKDTYIALSNLSIYYTWKNI